MPSDKFRSYGRNVEHKRPTLGDNQGWINERLLERIEYVPIDTLNPYTNNPRKHSKRQEKMLDRSLAEFGIVLPILVYTDNTVIAGEAVLESARRLGFSIVPVAPISHLTHAEIKALRIALNRLTELSEWDAEKLALEFQGLIEIDFDPTLSGFEMGEIDLVIENQLASNALAPADDVLPPSDDSVSQVGDLWVLGSHLILCGNARDPEAYKRLLRGEVAQMVITDPPWNVSINKHVSGTGRHREFAEGSGELLDEEFKTFLEDFVRNAVANSSDGAVCCIFIDWRHLQILQEVCDRYFSTQLNLCVWVKPNGGMGSMYRSRHELIVVYKNGNAPHINNVELGRYGRNRTNVWEYDGCNSFSPERRADLALHPTPKPVTMIAEAIKDASKRGGLVLDPFVGSGTTVIACEETGRICAGIELDPLYVDVIDRRWEAFAGGEAHHAETSLTFEQMSKMRQAGTLLLPPPHKSGEG